MAEEDEIDILSEFNLNNLLQKSEATIYDHSEFDSHHSNSIHCDCSAPWSSNHASHSFWDSNVHADYCTELSQEHLYNLSENVVGTNYSTDITDNSGWTKMEKNLLTRGIEIFGKSSVRLAQFIGSKTADEIKTYLKSFYLDTQSIEESIVEDTITESAETMKHNTEGLILDDAEIPASIEEVIAVVTTAVPTIPINSHKNNKIKKKLTKNSTQAYKHVPANNSPFKHKRTKVFIHQNDYYTKQRINKKKQIVNMERSTKKLTHGKQGNIGVKTKCDLKVDNTNCSLIEDVSKDPPSNRINAIPSLNGEEVVKMKKEDLEVESASDIEVDIEDVSGDENKERDISEDSVERDVDAAYPGSSRQLQIPTSTNTGDVGDDNITDENLCDVSDEILQQLNSLELPRCEYMLQHNVVSDMEKFVNREFFCGRPTKTPQRYLKIRNHILSLWSVSKPMYVTKTSVRVGLKQCGDVNSISRVHQLLEQIGAINFGCSQLTYIRPLSELFLERTPNVKEKVFTLPPPKPIFLSRPRIKKKFTNDGEGGCTLTHDEKGDVISTTVINEEPVVKQRPYNKKPMVRLIYCKPFSDENPQPYSIVLHLTPLLLMDFHAHISRAEVMGLIGGRWNSGSRRLVITCYIPCRNIAPSATHCDMCPISQAKAADVIHSEGLNILGWFHSHPTFAPEPSQQDLDTQLTVQQWIGINKPCIGLILSPFSAHGALIASPYRCLIVDKKTNFEDQYVPYKFKTELISSNLDIDFLLSEAWRIYNKDCNIDDSDKVDFNRPYFLDSSISYLDKFISSVKMHLAKCTEVNKMSCDSIISGFSNICLNNN